ncbi:hypothetical protein [Rhodoplanes sp. Z2-YC6860]|uniref:hypothetical protein n=1 Tax=Rhodoplanes sp. Z2-YC6860 TaxID=674703 RepID=UPI0012ED519E|nr:hypothetical protein [Rhodoplanes sp. Z2-YC6860]
MPQIWLSYLELGSLLQCRPDEARSLAITVGADRKKSRDGLSRVKLTATWMDLWIQQIRGADRFQRAAEEIWMLPHMDLTPAVEPKPEQSQATEQSKAA